MAHGRWRATSDAHRVYERFPAEDVIAIPAKMVGAQPELMPTHPVGPRVIPTAREPVVRLSATDPQNLGRWSESRAPMAARYGRPTEADSTVALEAIAEDSAASSPVSGFADSSPVVPASPPVRSARVRVAPTRFSPTMRP